MITSLAMSAIALSAVQDAAAETDLATELAGGSAPSANSINAADSKGDTEIVVTARRREERLQDVPVAVSVITGDKIEQTGDPRTYGNTIARRFRWSTIARRQTNSGCMWDVPPPDPAVEMLVASRGMTKGLSQTEGPQVLARASLRLGDLQFAALWKNVSAPSSDGEAWFNASASHTFGTVQLGAGITYKLQTGVRGRTDSDSIEFSGGASRKFGPVTVRVSAIYSPDDLGPARRSLFVEGGPAVQLGKGWTASAGVGRRSRELAPNYTSFNLGVSKTIKSLQLDVRYYDTDRSGIGDPYRARLVGSARLSF